MPQAFCNQNKRGILRKVLFNESAAPRFKRCKPKALSFRVQAKPDPTTESPMLKMEKIEISQKYPDGDVYFECSEVSLQSTNLIIGPNASGKSQFFKRLKFLKDIHKKSAPTPYTTTILHAKVVLKDESTGKEINYNLKAGPGELIEETIDSKSRKYLRRKGGNTLLLDEKTNEAQAFLINKRQSITKQIEDRKDSFPTIDKIGFFFESMLFLDADKFNSDLVMFGDKQLIPSERMENLSSAVLNWKKKFPDVYNSLLKEYKKFFQDIEDISSEEFTTPDGGVFEMLAIKERGVRDVVAATYVSSGMLRILSLLALPMCRHLSKHAEELGFDFNPSMIVIDEIDNGLDYERTGHIIDYLDSEAAFVQVIFSSHSPVVCNFVSPERWRIFNRTASSVNITNPLDVKETREMIEKSKSANWDVYANHISRSRRYNKRRNG